MTTVRALLRSPARRARLPLLVLAVGGLAWSAAGRAQAPPDPDPSAATELESSQQSVAVESPAADEQIRRRLVRILQATERFQEPSVQVEEGVVFLAGRTAEPRHREWATELARKTEDVVAVVNNIEVVEGPLWTLEPAVREMRQLWRQVVQAAPLVALGVTVLVLTLLAGGLLARVTTRGLARRVHSALVRNVVGKVVVVAVGLIGIYLFLRISGLTRIAVTLAGGTGLVGLVVGFAFRDIAENFLASILISVQRPFRIGDTIEVDGHLGVVQMVTTRGTVLMDFDGNHIQIANATVYKKTIRNLTANPKMRIGFVTGVGYDAAITEAQRIALDVLREHSAVLAEPEPIVLVEALGAATISIRVYAWIDGHEHSVLKVRSSLMRLVVRAYDAAGISMPDELRELVFPQPVPIRMLEPDAAKPHPAPPEPRAAPEAEAAAEVTEGEGDLRSEVSDLRRQAREARSPEEGVDILESDAPSPP